MTFASTSQAARFDMGRVVSRMFGSIGRNLVVFGLLALLLGGGPQLLVYLGAAGAQIAGGGVAPAAWIIGGIGAVGMLMGMFVLQAALIHGVVVDLAGQKASFGDCLSTGLRRAFPVLGIGVLYALGCGFGLIFLVVPGVFLALVWIVAVPAEVMERTGVFGAFSRSADLTRNHRGSLLGLLAVYLLVSWILGSVAVAVMLGFGGASAVISGGPSSHSLLLTIANAIAQTLQSLIGAAGVASIYYELRTIKEGVSPDSLASVFD